MDGITVLKAFSYEDVTKIFLIDLNNFIIFFNQTKDNEYQFQSQQVSYYHNNFKKKKKKKKKVCSSNCTRINN